MTSKRVEYAPEAVTKMRRRGFTRQDIRWVLERGQPAPAWQRPGAATRFARRAYIGKREAQVVYLENDARILVVSPQWIISKGAVARQKKGRQPRKRGK